MADVVDAATRSRMMAGIQAKNTRPELVVRRGLHRDGFRYRLHSAALPGKPDLVLRRYHAVVFVHGCFWHGHRGCRDFKIPKTRPDFWERKIASNRSRDARQIQSLLDANWRVAVVWECSLRTDAHTTISQLQDWLRHDRPDVNGMRDSRIASFPSTGQAGF